MRRPNGTGTVYKLSGKRRKPWIVRKTVGWDEDGKQVLKTLGYAESRKEGLKMLEQFNTNPRDLTSVDITVKELFDLWSAEKYKTASKIRRGVYDRIYKQYLSPISETHFISLRASDWQSMIDTCTAKSHELEIKTVANQLYAFAMKNDVIDKDYSSYITLPPKIKAKKKPFTKEEIAKLWERSTTETWAEVLLMYIYSGVRANELLNLEPANVHIGERYFICGSKTEAGKDRMVPIHKKTLPFFEKRMQGQKYLIEDPKRKGTKMLYKTLYLYRCVPVFDALGMQHTLHETRHTFISLATEAGVNPTILRKIVGHAGTGVTEDVYTHISVESLVSEIDKIC